MYIYIYICTVYTVIWEYGNYTGPNSIFAERERERKSENLVVSVCGMFTHQYAI